jgi:uncharacterized protein (TIGR02466 family)
VSDWLAPAAHADPHREGRIMAKAIDVGKGIMLTYTTPIFAKQMRGSKRVNESLRTQVLLREVEVESLSKSNVGGWHSPADFFSWPGSESTQLLDWICESVQTMTAYMAQQSFAGTQIEVSGWANVSRRGHYHRAHIHPGHDWSGVYYVDPGERTPQFPDSGIIEFADPRAGVTVRETPGAPFSGVVHFQPEPGLLLLFPSWLSHAVNAYQGDGERISISFNVCLSKPPATD